MTVRILEAHPGLRELLISEPTVLVTRFGEFTVNFQVMFWARDYAEQGLAKSEVYEAVHDGLTAAGIEIPVPTRRLIHESESEHA